MLLFGALVVLCGILGEWLFALALAPSILLSWWLLCDEHDIEEMLTEQDRLAREVEDLKKSTEKIKLADSEEMQNRQAH